MRIEELARMIHENAVQHGWWEEKREPAEVNALIHSEWSEALEEARAGRPLVWYACGEANSASIPCNPADDTECRMYGREAECEYRGHKPEGIAVELIDGCIRILDYLGNVGIEDVKMPGGKVAEIEDLYSDANVGKVPDRLPVVVAYLHAYTASALFNSAPLPLLKTFELIEAMAVALSWVKKQGLDPLALLMEKHEYNKGRPYKHGKAF